MKWTDERIELLKTLHAAGHPGSFIAERLGGVTRNAVIGKVHRLKLGWHRRPEGKAPRAKAARKQKGRAVPVLRFGRGIYTLVEESTGAEIPEPPPENRIATLNLKSRSCRWPIGDPRDPGFGFCGEKAIGALGSRLPPYCERHARKAYTQPQVRRRVWG